MEKAVKPFHARSFHMKRIIALAAAVLALGMGLASTSVQAVDCQPPCWKDPITGKIICGTPCP
jgi:hypothetical protein